MTIELESDSQENEVTWALENITSNKAAGVDEIVAKLFKTLQDDAVKVFHGS